MHNKQMCSEYTIENNLIDFYTGQYNYEIHPINKFKKLPL
jgi:hypothetical protein